MKYILLLFMSFLFLSSFNAHASFWDKAEESSEVIEETSTDDSDNDVEAEDDTDSTLD